MAGVTISISGIKELQQKFDAVKNQDGLRGAITEATALVEGSARSNCPVDTGALRRSIHMKIEEQDRKVAGVVYTSNEHAPYVEFGTGKRGSGSYQYAKDVDMSLSYDPNWPGQVAQPFLVPALLMNKNQIKVLVAKGVASSLKGDN